MTNDPWRNEPRPSEGWPNEPRPHEQQGGMPELPPLPSGVPNGHEQRDQGGHHKPFGSAFGGYSGEEASSQYQPGTGQYDGGQYGAAPYGAGGQGAGQQNTEPFGNAEQYGAQSYGAPAFGGETHLADTYPTENYPADPFASNQQVFGEYGGGYPNAQFAETYPGQTQHEHPHGYEATATLDDPLETLTADQQDTEQRNRGISAGWLVAILAVVAIVVAAGAYFLFNGMGSGVDTATQNTTEATTAEGDDPAQDSGASTATADAATDTVREYLAALEAGDVAASLEFVDPANTQIGDGTIALYALEGATSRIQVLAVEVADEREDSVSVRATLSLENEQFEHVFRLSPVDEGWAIDEPLLAALDIVSDDVNVTIGGVDVTVYDTLRVYLYPGVYPVTSPGGETQQVRIAAPSSTPPTVTFSTETEIDAAFESAVLTQVRDRLTLCTDISGNMDAECPSITQNTELESLTVVSQPSGFDDITETSFTTTVAEIQVVDIESPGNRNPSPRTQTFHVTGDITIVDGQPVISNVRSR